MAAPDLKAHLIGSTRAVYRRVVNDLQAIPADRQNVSPGGRARAPLRYVAECAAVNGFVAEYLNTGVMPAGFRLVGEEREKALARFDTERKALAFLARQTEALIAALEKLDIDTLGDASDALGVPMTRLSVAAMPAEHMAYHDGQLNTIHGLCGDDQMHW